MKGKVFISAFVMFAFVAISAYGQNDTASQAQIDSLQIRISHLEKRAATWDKIKQHFKLSGYIQAGYEWNDMHTYNNGGVSTSTGASTFFIRRARLSLSGSALQDKIDYKLQVDFAGTPKIVDLYIRYRPFNELGLQLGQFLIPLTIENTNYAGLKHEFINNSLTIQRFVHMGSSDLAGISSSGRNLGAQLYGGFIKKKGFSIINYNLAVLNGNVINSKDNNKSKDFVGRLIVKPHKYLDIAGYYMYGEFVKKDVTNYGGLHRYGGGVCYDCPTFFVRSEYVGGKTIALKSEGAYLAGGYRFCGKGAAVARIEYFDTDKSDSAYEMMYTVGLNYKPISHLLLQLNYSYNQYCNYVNKNANTVSVMVSAIF